MITRSNIYYTLLIHVTKKADQSYFWGVHNVYILYKEE